MIPYESVDVACCLTFILILVNDNVLKMSVLRFTYIHRRKKGPAEGGSLST